MSRFPELKDKVVLVTGGTKGIGRSIAIAFAKEGTHVCISYKSNRQKAEALKKEIENLGVECMTMHMDVTSRKDIQDVVSAVQSKYHHLDILVNNIGYLEQKPFFDITDTDWNYAISANLNSVFMCTQEVAKIFSAQKHGSIINISSVGGQTGGPKAPHYSAAKAGVISFTKSTARILAPFGIRVNAVSPGFIQNTDMYEMITRKSSKEDINSDILLQRPGEPEEVANAVIFLASDNASYITGHILNVNGGFYLG